MEEFINVFKNFTNFSGRTSRRDFIIANLIQLGICIAFVFYAIFATSLYTEKWFDSLLEFIYIIYGLFTIVPFWALTVRRLHDTGRSGLNILWSFIPIIGTITIIIFLLEKSRNEDNKYTEEKNKTRLFVPVLCFILSTALYFGFLKYEIDYYMNLYYIEDASYYYGTWEYQNFENYKGSEKDKKSGYIFTDYKVELDEKYFFITYDFQVIERNNDELERTYNTENYASGTLKTEDGKIYLMVDSSDIPDIYIGDKIECNVDENGNFVLNIPNIGESYVLQYKY